MTLELLDWRRQVSELYARVRARLAVDPAAAHDHWSSTRDALFADHPASPLPQSERDRFAGLPLWPYDPELAFLADVDTAVPGERYPIGRSGSGTIDFVHCGRITLPLGSGATLDLFWLDAYGGGLFLPFRDATAGTDTYGGGRYLLDTAKGADLGARDGALVIDFNFAYHPSCRYDQAWSCPLAPPCNWLDEPVRAGERCAPR